MANSKYHNGELCVIVNGPWKGRIGVYEFLGEKHETVYLKQGCLRICVCPADLEIYNEDKHGILSW